LVYHGKSTLLKFLDLIKTPIVFLIIATPLSAQSSVNPDSAAYYYQKALASKEQKRGFEADKNFKKAIDFSPDDINLRISYAGFLADDRKYFVAFDQLKKVIAASPNNAVALQKITEVTFQLHRWQDVISYGNMVEATGKGVRISYMLGKALYEEEEYGQAEKILLKAVQQNAGDLDAVMLPVDYCRKSVCRSK